MSVHRLSYSTALKTTLRAAWNYFSNPKNLNSITPPDLHFEILSGAEQSMYAGQIICYKVQVIKGIKRTWVTEITHKEELRLFVDEQKIGPYKFWHHQHKFHEVKAGVQIIDIVHYQLPMGIFGEIAQRIFVKKRLHSIFNYRQEKLKEIFK